MDQINEMLAQLQELTDEQVSELESTILGEFDSVEQQDLTPESVDSLESLANAVEAVRTEQSRRVVQREELTNKASEAAQRVRGTESTDAESPEDEENVDETAMKKLDPSDPNAPADPAVVDPEDQTEPPEIPGEAPDPEDAMEPPEPDDELPGDLPVDPLDPNKKKVPVAYAAESTETVAEAPVAAELAVQTEPVATTPAPAPVAVAVAEQPTGSEAATATDTEATTTEQSPQGAEAASESEGTTAEAPAEAENSIPTPEVNVTTVAASGSDASLEIEAPADRRPIPSQPTATVSITAGADIPGVSAGSKFETMDRVAEAFVNRLHSIRHVNGGDGEQHIVASLQYEFPESRMLEPNDPSLNTSRIQSVTSTEALTAAAGICLPLETRYDMNCDVGVTDRPIRDSLARFGADRGGIRFFDAPVLTDMAGATGFWRGDTNGQNWHTYGPDATTATSPANLKPCLEVQCTSEQTAYIEAVTLCLTFNNLTTRVFPELIKRHNELALVAHARIAENHLLAQLEAGSTPVTIASTVLGAAPELFNLLGRAIAVYRHKHRMNNVAPLRMLAPSWLMDLLRADMAMRMPGDGLENTFGIAESQINAWFSARNVNITWHIDGVGPTSDSNSFDFPSTVEFGLWAEGTWLYLDGGTLDLGVIRDSSLVATNQYKQFVETFEGLANMGCDSFWVSAPLEACGSAAALVATC